MKKVSLILWILVGFVSCNTPKGQLLNEKTAQQYAQYIQTDELKSHLYKLASDEFRGRLTGEPGQKKAAQYLKNYYQGLNISSPLGDTVYFQNIPSSFFDYQLKSSENVLALIKGSQFPEQVVVISAHYDHVGTKNGQVYHGADDDASGTVTVMQIAKAFKKAATEGHRPKRSILLLHFTGEEEGLFGSKYYTQHPVFPLENTIVDLNIDMIGRIDEAHQSNPEYIYLIGSKRLSSTLDSIINQQNAKHTKLSLDYKYNAEDDPLRLYYRSDHYNFAKHNIPVAFFFSGLHEDYHKPTDTADKIEYDLLTKRAKLIFYTAWEIANRDKALKVDQH